MRTPLIAGNWKMHKTVAEAVALVRDLEPRIREVTDVEVVVAPPFTALEAVARACADGPIGVAAQNMHWEPAGAYTGEVSAEMVREAGASWVILGHSERRQYFGETDAGVSRRTRRALDNGLTPIVCVGETLEQREAGDTFAVLEAQVRGALEPLPAERLRDLVVAYEPVWAIGTGKTASAAQAQEVHARIRSWLGTLGGADTAAAVRILYGGSVKPDNAAELMAQEDVDGGLVGGASLEAEKFASIVAFRV